MRHDVVGRSIVIPIANPSSARPLITCAARIAARDGGVLLPVTVIRPRAPADERAAAWLALADAEEVARELEAPVAAEVIEHEHVADGVLGLATRAKATLVLMGWRGRSSTTDVFGRLTDTIVGRSAIPLAIVRLGTAPFRRVVLPVGDDHLRPGGERGMRLAAELAGRIGAYHRSPATILRTGEASGRFPEALAGLAGEVRHDPRRTDQAVAAFAGPEDLVVTPVAPTATGLRAATTHLAWAAPESTLLVAVDVGPTVASSSAAAGAASSPKSPVSGPPLGEGDPVRVVVTARLAEHDAADPDRFARVLALVGSTDEVMAWWPAGDARPHLRATVAISAASANEAIASLMVAVHEAPGFEGAELTYDVDRGPPTVERVRLEEGGIEIASDRGVRGGPASAGRHLMAARGPALPIGSTGRYRS